MLCYSLRKLSDNKSQRQYLQCTVHQLVLLRACNRENLLNWQVERFVQITNWLWNMTVDSIKQLSDRLGAHLWLTPLYTTLITHISEYVSVALL